MVPSAAVRAPPHDVVGPAAGVPPDGNREYILFKLLNTHTLWCNHNITLCVCYSDAFKRSFQQILLKLTKKGKMIESL